jgi:putative lipoic acid-binding regulatory protein
MAERRVDVYDGSGDIDLWLIKMKFYCSTKKYEGKQEAHAIASKLDGPAFLCIARLSDEDQDDPKKVKEALKREFDKVAVDHETAVAELAQIKRISDETPAQLAWRVEKVTRKAYPGLSEAKEESATQTYEQMLQDKFLEAIDEEMSKKIKDNGNYRRMNITALAEELERLELIYKRKLQPKISKVNEVKKSDDIQTHNLRQIVKEEIEAALCTKSDEENRDEKQINLVGGRYVNTRSWVPGRQFSGRGRFGNNTRGRGKPRGISNGGQSGVESKRNCFHCDSEYHFRRNCPFVHLCQRCWKAGHIARNCKAAAPSPSPALNYQAAGNNQ